MQDLIRSFYLEHRKDIDDIRLTQGQHDLLIAVRKAGEITTSDLVISTGQSIQNANIKLKTLYHKGWLNRRDVGDPTGGSQYVYDPK